MNQFSCPFVLLSEPRPIRNTSYRPSSRREHREPRMSAGLPPLNTYLRDTTVSAARLPPSGSSDLTPFSAGSVKSPCMARPRPACAKPSARHAVEMLGAVEAKIQRLLCVITLTRPSPALSAFGRRDSAAGQAGARGGGSELLGVLFEDVPSIGAGRGILSLPLWPPVVRALTGVRNTLEQG